MAPEAEQRAKGVALPPWWLEKVRELVDERKEELRENLTQLGKLLAEAVGRDRPWDHGSVSRFLNEKNTTIDMTLAFCELFGLPRPVFMARTWDEALSMTQTSRRYDGRALSAAQGARIATVDQVVEAVEEEIDDQTRGVASKDEGGARGRRTGRAVGRRSPTS